MTICLPPQPPRCAVHACISVSPVFAPTPGIGSVPSRSLPAGVSLRPETGVSEVFVRIRSAGGRSQGGAARDVDRGLLPLSRWRRAERLSGVARSDSGDSRITGNVSRTGARIRACASQGRWGFGRCPLLPGAPRSQPSSRASRTAGSSAASLFRDSARIQSRNARASGLSPEPGAIARK